MADRCERCWGRAGLEPFAPEGGRPALLCRSCRAAAPQDLLMFREVFLRFSSTKEMVSHYDARDEEEALRKLCNEKRLDFKSVIRAIESHGRAEPSNGFLDFSRPYGYEMRDGGLRVRPEETVHVGDDAEADVRGAQALGMRAVHCDHAGKGDCTFADARIHGFRELLGVLARW